MCNVKCMDGLLLLVSAIVRDPLLTNNVLNTYVLFLNKSRVTSMA